MQSRIVQRPSERDILLQRLANKLETNSLLNRKLVSFQVSKSQPIYRWLKYKEGFSAGLVKFFLKELAPKRGKILDPFAGVGTTLFAAQDMGWESHGIEILPIGPYAIKTRETLKYFHFKDLPTFDSIWNEFSKHSETDIHFKHIPITKDAFPLETEQNINRFMTFLSKIQDESLRTILNFALLSILEEMSYTRKDGQFLRWDYRCNRNLSGKPFNKGPILGFRNALENKLNQMIEDLTPNKHKLLFEIEEETDQTTAIPVSIIEGSCLEKLPALKSESFDFIFTSPPYCNRYDYTRTYALELVYLGYSNEQTNKLRQTMLSCTVENKDKVNALADLYSNLDKKTFYEQVTGVYKNSQAMTEVNDVLSQLLEKEVLNNSNVPRMIRNYFLEMAFVIAEMGRVLKSGGYCVMINDNVRYGGEEIPVDLILSDFAESLGFRIDKILVLPRGKGNSSQQMGLFGRTEIRKCVYLWQKI